ncbi:MAG: 50S ribosomal protein L25 [Clostridia bacterium]
MEESVLKAITRSENPKKVRNAGFIPGVLNGDGATATSVQFESVALHKIIAKHGANAKIWVELGTDKKFGFIKEVQKFPMDGKLMHITIQLVSQDKEVKMQLPISYHGQGELEHNLLQVQVYKPEIEVSGKALIMPDVVVVDISKKALGDTITAGDFDLPKALKILDMENETYAIIKAIKEVIVEEPEEVTPVEEA